MEYASRDSRGFEPESADAIYRYANGRFDYGIREERERRIPSAVDGFLWRPGGLIVELLCWLPRGSACSAMPGYPQGKRSNRV